MTAEYARVIVSDMGETVHAYALEEIFYQQTRKDPEWARLAAEVRNKLEAGAYDRWLVDAVFQLPEIPRARQPRLSLAEAYGFAVLRTDLLLGKTLHFMVRVGKGPGPDARIDYNQKLLNKLPEPFNATFAPERGRSANCDGSFAWNETIEAIQTFVQEDSSERIKMKRLPPYSVSLEVGTTSVSKTAQHLRAGGVARWAYDSEWVVVLLPVTDLPPSRRCRLSSRRPSLAHPTLVRASSPGSREVVPVSGPNPA